MYFDQWSASVHNNVVHLATKNIFIHLLIVLVSFILYELIVLICTLPYRQFYYLRFLQENIKILGHSFEARIYAEDPENDFMPGAGKLLHLSAPPETPNVRIETGVQESDEVSPYYDPMIAKLVVFGPDRSTALKDLERNLNLYSIVGLSSNIAFLQRLASNPSFVEGDVHTGFIDQHFDELFPPKLTTVALDVATRATCAYLLMEDDKTTVENPFSLIKDFKINLPPSRNIALKIDGHDVALNVTRLDQARSSEKKFKVKLSNEEAIVSGRLETNDGGAVHHVTTTVNDVMQRHKVVVIAGGSHDHDVQQDNIFLFPTSNETTIAMSLSQPSFYANLDSSGATGSQPIAPMTGKVEKVLVSAGDAVTEGQPLVVMIAMKMEHTIRSPRDGIVESVLYGEGDQADKGALLVRLESEPGD